MQYKYDNSPDKRGKPKHSHLLDLYSTGEFKRLTGTSSVVDVLSKVLTWWAAGCAVSTMGWVYPDIKKGGKKVGEVPEKERLKIANKTLAKIKKFSSKQYLALLDDAYKAHSVKLKDTAEAGTDLHAELERFVKWTMHDKDIHEQFDPRIQPYRDWQDHAIKEYLWSEAYCFDENLWVGGISDVGCILNAHTIETVDGQIEIPDGTRAIIDFKSAKELYTSHFIQGAGYALQMEKNGILDKDGKLMGKLNGPIEAIVIVAFGMDTVYPEVRMKAAEYKEGFKHALALYRLLGMDKSEYKK